MHDGHIPPPRRPGRTPRPPLQTNGYSGDYVVLPGTHPPVATLSPQALMNRQADDAALIAQQQATEAKLRSELRAVTAERDHYKALLTRAHEITRV